MPHVVPPAAPRSIDITDDRARLDLTRKSFVLDHPGLRSVSHFLLLLADKHDFHERPGFTPEREMTMMLRR